uniref:Uncharacterized protein n=1 Tax=Siphoviridae sp. ct4Z13 TaxID=2827778 RepID=A0A8S5SBF6_9CAUD|nr:MAG TPA: hypothetical protein [Siphoviridae sp. ct4Z13]
MPFFLFSFSMLFYSHTYKKHCSYVVFTMILILPSYINNITQIRKK